MVCLVQCARFNSRLDDGYNLPTASSKPFACCARNILSGFCLYQVCMIPLRGGGRLCELSRQLRVREQIAALVVNVVGLRFELLIEKDNRTENQQTKYEEDEVLNCGVYGE